ncbi:MAG: rod shape-determining protein RodA [Candidatus Buchananbacteria bacterium RBG_13_36_9]|uniref:Rod shape-determining protein RodA n=1 Tax=Candidatus Buchananbacteria bacterium RBG_13_36_9 TaxID=1797530 RepID=A0A1G1XQ48_9BACT|nr:MAG: rod shape-determining protein RodA [Candidatus Buchananbacteria bacterium RBG_13_36_9]
MKIKGFNFIFKKIDWLLLTTVCLLVVLGLILLYSTALGSGTEQSLLNFKKQIAFFILGIFIVLLIAVFVDYRALMRYSYVLYGVAIFLLVLVLFLGKTIRGTTGWFYLGLFSFQPVEFVKIFLILYLAKFFSDKAKYIVQFKYFVLSSLGVILAMVLIVLQPDFGSAIIIFTLWLVLIFLTGIKKSHLLFLIILVVIISLVFWVFIFQPYQKERISVFLNPNLDPLGSGYNRSQAIIAIGSGQIFGKGLAFGSQSQLKFLPESQTDFIFAVLGEELGLAGILLLLMLYGYLLYRLLKIAKRTKDNFALYIILSICVLFFVHIFINIGGNLGILPITGITLPFLSYGGSSLVANMILIGLAESIIIRGINISSEDKDLTI